MGSDQDRRALLAIVLSLGVYLLWTFFFAPKPDPSAADLITDQSTTEAAPATPVAPVAPAAAVAPAVAQVPTSQVVPEHSEPLQADGWRAVVDSANGAVTDLSLTRYSAPPTVTPVWTWLMGRFGAAGGEGDWEAYSGGDEPEQIVTPEGALVLAGAGAIDDDGSGKLGDPSYYTVQRIRDGVQASRVLSNGLRITKTYRPGKLPHTMDVELRFDNTGTTAVSDLWVGVSDHMEGKAGRFANAPRPTACVDESVEHVNDLDDLEGDESEVFEGPVEWFGVGSRYFMAVLVPQDMDTDHVLVDQLPGGRYGSFAFDKRPLEAGQSRTLHFTAFVGPKQLELLKQIGSGLDKAVEFGWFGFFSKILLFLLKSFQKVVTNWGVAIILLTVLVKLVFFPLTQKAFVSSRRMQALQPQMNAVKEKYKDNKELQSQETMKLMKENNVNPMGGCLPTLIQLPVWLALYRVMLQSVELYDTSFLYLKDLTAADPYGVLPLLYVGLMVGQQRMMPMTGMDPTQQKMMRLFPLFFGFIMFGFPSGLVLYFSVNMLLTIFQQWLIKRNHKEIPVKS